MKRDLKDLERIALRAGWDVTPTRSGHKKWRSPSGAVVITASTPSAPRAIQNIKGYLRRAGLPC